MEVSGTENLLLYRRLTMDMDRFPREGEWRIPSIHRWIQIYSHRLVYRYVWSDKKLDLETLSNDGDNSRQSPGHSTFSPPSTRAIYDHAHVPLLEYKPSSQTHVTPLFSASGIVLLIRKNSYSFDKGSSDIHLTLHPYIRKRIS